MNEFDGPRRSRKKLEDISAFADKIVVLSAGEPIALPLRVASSIHSTQRKTKYFDLTALAPLGTFANIVSTEFIKYISGYRLKTSEMYLSSVRRLFVDIQSADIRCLLPADLQSANAQQWHSAAKAWAYKLESDNDIELGTRISYISTASKFLRHLQDSGCIPRFRLPDTPSTEGVIPSRKLSIAETGLKLSKLHSEAGIDPAPDNQSAMLEPPSAVIEAGEEAVALWRELRALPNGDHPSAMLALINSHLTNLRNCAEIEVRQTWNNHIDTKKQIERVNIQDILDFLEDNSGRSSRALGKGGGKRSIFERREDLLAYISYRYNGVIPTFEDDPSLVRLIYNKHSVSEISELFHLTTNNIVGFIIIILIETNMNVGSIYEWLASDCLADDGVPGERRISWIKYRTNAERQKISLPVGSTNQLDSESKHPITAPKALECIIKLREPLASHVFDDESDRLLLVRRGAGNSNGDDTGPVTPLIENTFIEAWKRFRSRHVLLGDLPIRMDQIRTTILLKTALESNGDIYAVRARAHHKKLSTTMRYIEGPAMEFLDEQKVANAQNFLFVSATGDNHEIQLRFGISGEDAVRIAGQARRKGFGIQCQNDQNGTAPGTRPGETCFRLDHCAVCSERIVIENVSVAAEMSAFRRHIRLNRDDLKHQHPERWKNVWGPMLLFLNTGLMRMSPNIKLEGKRAAKSLNFGFFKFD